MLYTGITTDVTRRLRQHKGEIKGGAKALRGKQPLQLEGLWQTDSKSTALKYEAYIKSLRRNEKVNLLASDSPPVSFNVQKSPLPRLQAPR